MLFEMHWPIKLTYNMEFYGFCNSVIKKNIIVFIDFLGFGEMHKSTPSTSGAD